MDFTLLSFTPNKLKETIMWSENQKKLIVKHDNPFKSNFLLGILLIKIRILIPAV